MSIADFKAMFGDYWPYFVVIIIGFLPTEVWRWLAVALSKDMREDSDILIWVRMVATTLLAAVVAKMVAAPAGVLATVPLWGRILSIGGAASALFLFRKSVVAAVLAGEILLIGSWFLARS